jgi:hypothetical protein
MVTARATAIGVASMPGLDKSGRTRGGMSDIRSAVAPRVRLRVGVTGAGLVRNCRPMRWCRYAPMWNAFLAWLLRLRDMVAAHGGGISSW